MFFGSAASISAINCRLPPAHFKKGFAISFIILKKFRIKVI
jgi:hypothetical protein